MRLYDSTAAVMCYADVPTPSTGSRFSANTDYEKLHAILFTSLRQTRFVATLWCNCGTYEHASWLHVESKTKCNNCTYRYLTINKYLHSFPIILSYHIELIIKKSPNWSVLFNWSTNYLAIPTYNNLSKIQHIDA